MANLKVYLSAETKNFQRGLRRADYKLKQFSKSVVRYGAVAAAGMVAFGVKSVMAFDEQAQAEARLQQTLKATGGAAGISMKAMKDHAAELQKLTTYGDESVIGFQALLATFKEVKGDQFKEATELGLDMSAALGQDLKSSAIQLGKALNDPVKGITALSRVGVSFSDVQKQQIKQFVESGQLAEAQGVILAELRSEFGGVAEAQAKVGLGPWKQIGNAAGDIMEGVGGIITEVINLNGETGSLTEKFGNWAKIIKQNTPLIVFEVKTAFEIIKTAFKNSFDFLRISIMNSVRAFKNFGAGIGILASNIYGTFASVFKWWKDNWLKLFTNLDKLSSESFRSMGKFLLDSMLVPIRIIGGQLKDMFDAVKKRDFASFMKAITPLDNIKSELDRLKSDIGNVFESVSKDLGVAAPEIKVFEGAFDKLLDPGQWENALDAIDKNQKDKVKALAQLEADLKKKLLDAEAKRREEMAAAMNESPGVAAAADAGGMKQADTISDQFLKIGGIVSGQAAETKTTGYLSKQTALQEKMTRYLETLATNGVAVPRFA